MYSDTIDKICRVCIHARQEKGIITHMRCELDGGYYPVRHTCPKFKYDILKKQVRRKREVPKNKFRPEDFSLEDV
jgi:hypothetical protein